MRSGAVRSASHTSAAILAAAAFASAACGPEPVPLPPPSAHATPAARASEPPLAPEEEGISDLARVSRYVYREMSGRRECALARLPAGRYEYVLEVAVAKGRITDGRLAAVSVTDAPRARPLPKPEWPAALEQRTACLLPHLKRLPLTPVPTDGVYATRFIVGAQPN